MLTCGQIAVWESSVLRVSIETVSGVMKLMVGTESCVR